MITGTLEVSALKCLCTSFLTFLKLFFFNLIAMYILKKMEQNVCSLDGSVFLTILLHRIPGPADTFPLTISPSFSLKACNTTVQEHPDVAMVCAWVCHVAWYYPHHFPCFSLSYISSRSYEVYFAIQA